MKLNAYILAADPAWIEASVLSYYDIVDRIVVSYDADGRGWTGAPVRVDECLRRLRSVDSRSKLDLRPGHFARSQFFDGPMANETHQRQTALEQAADGADWILQLDTDELLADPPIFISCLEGAAASGARAMEFPARWLYQRLRDGRFLESASRFWRIAAGFPGPVAVRPGVRLRCARQCDAPLYRVDFRHRNTDPWHPTNAPVHRVIRPDQGIVHLSMVRTEPEMKNKLDAWGHAKDRDWDPETRRWLWCRRHPYLAVLRTPFIPRRQSNTHRPGLRIATIAIVEKLTARHVDAHPARGREETQSAGQAEPLADVA